MLNPLRKLPVAPFAYFSALNRQQRRGWKFANAFENAAWCRNIAQMQIACNGTGVEFGARTGKCEQSLCLCCKCQLTPILHNVKRFHAKSVTANQQSSATCIPQREIKHAVEPMDKVVSFCGVEMNQNFTV